jgi:hypothetical protein
LGRVQHELKIDLGRQNTPEQQSGDQQQAEVAGFV